VRIAYIHQYYTTPDMPGGTRSYEMARRLARRGHEVHVITTDTWAEQASMSWSQHVDADGVHIHQMPVPYKNGMSFQQRIRAFAQFALTAGIRAARVKPDIVFASSTPLTVAVPGLMAARLRRARFVFEVRDLWPELPIEVGALRNPVAKRLAFALARAAYRNADHVVALSEGMADGVVAQGYPRERITVVPNGCDVDLFTVPEAEVKAFRASHDWLQDRPLVLYAGTFGVVNGVDYLVRLAAKVADLDPQVRFLLLGDGKTMPAVKRLAGELGVLDTSVFVRTGIPKSQMPAVVGAATMAVSTVVPLPGMQANSANKVFDAMAASRPVLINHEGWQADLLRETGAGLVLDPFDLDGAAAELVARLRDPQWLEEAGAASGGLAAGRFSRDRLFQQFEAALLPGSGEGAALAGQSVAHPSGRG
jgi:glycosyltransferase involved in cell wall biosynthesis